MKKVGLLRPRLEIGLSRYESTHSGNVLWEFELPIQKAIGDERLVFSREKRVAEWA